MPDSIFLSHGEKENVRNWSYKSIDNSISTEMLTNYWEVCLALVPENVAPNVLTLAGLICLFQSCILTMSLYESRPILTGFLNILLIFSYQCLDAIDGKQARKTRSGSPVGELFNHICNSVGLLCIVKTMCLSLGVTSIWTQYLVINISSLVFLKKHLEAFTRTDHVVEHDLQRKYNRTRWTGPGETLLVCIGVLLLNMICPLNNLLTSCSPYVDKLLFSILIWTVLKIIGHLIYKTEYITRDSILLCFLYRFLHVYLFFDFAGSPADAFESFGSSSLRGMTGLGSTSEIIIFLHGLFWSIITGDLIVAKMAKRTLHPLIVIFAMLSSISNYLTPIIFVAYFWSIFSCLLEHMSLFMFRIRSK